MMMRYFLRQQVEWMNENLHLKGTVFRVVTESDL